jgi:hypothetical protein
MEMVQRRRDAREIPVVGGGLAACQSLGVLEEGGEAEQGLILVHLLLLLLFQSPAGVDERALHRPLLGDSVVEDYANGQGRGAERRIRSSIRTGC